MIQIHNGTRLDELVALHDHGLSVLASAPASQPHGRAGVGALPHRRRRVFVRLARLALAGVQNLRGIGDICKNDTE